MNRNKKIKIFFLLVSIVLILTILLLLNFPIVEFEVIGNKINNIEYKNTYQEEGIIAKVNFCDKSDKVIIDDTNVDYNKLGTYKILYKLELPHKRTKVLERVINVIDKTSPTIELLGNNPLVIKYNGTFTEPGYDVSDNYNSKENLTININYDKPIDTSKEGTYIVTYEVVDTSGNSTTITREVIVAPKAVTTNGFTYVGGVLIVNKTYSLPSNYNPGINSEAYSWLQKMQTESMKYGHSLVLLSGFRSYSSQKSIYNNYIRQYGQTLTDTFSARPGHSEHQTGLAFDVGWIDDSFGETERGKWLAQNAHKYGFIIRYPKGKEHITGYKYEPWHIRYLGIELATKVYNSGLSLEEYFGLN